MKKYPLAGTGTFTAIDINRGKVRWQKKEPPPTVGGATTTAGGLVFVGVSGKGVLRALDPKTGKLFLQHPLGARVDDAASVYSINGKGHVPIATGGSAVPYGGLAGSRATFTASAPNK